MTEKHQSLIPFLAPLVIVLPMLFVTFVLITDVNCDEILSKTDEEFKERYGMFDTKEDAYASCAHAKEIVGYLFWTLPVVLTIGVSWAVYKVRKHNKEIDAKKE